MSTIMRGSPSSGPLSYATTRSCRSISCLAASSSPATTTPSPSLPAPPPAIPALSRRFLLLATTTTAAASLLAVAPPSVEAETTTTTTASPYYVDPIDGFSLQVPSGWAQGSGGAIGGIDPTDPRARYSNAAGLQRVIAFVPPSTADVNIAITVRTPAADFTSLGSFGTAQQWGESLVASMDRSYMLRGSETGRGLFGGASASPPKDPVTVAKLVDVKEGENAQYIVKYTVSQEGAPTRYVVSAVALGTSPKGLRRFYTINGSTTAEKEQEFGKALERAIESFQVPE